MIMKYMKHRTHLPKEFKEKKNRQKAYNNVEK